MKLFGKELTLKRQCAQQSAFYHVLIADGEKPDELREVFKDRDEKELKRMVVNPYKKGTSLICGNEIIPVLQIKKIYIVRTAQCNQDEREAMLSMVDRLSWRKGSEFLNLDFGRKPEDILHAGEDVTSKYITAPPGSAFLKRLLSNPWVVAVGGGVLVYILGSILSYCFRRMVG